MGLYENKTGNGRRASFHSVLSGFLDTLATKGIDVLDVCAPVDPADHNSSHYPWRRDVVLLKDGRPLAGVNLTVTQSSLGDTAPRVGGDLAGAVGSLVTATGDALEASLDSMRRSFSSRVEKELGTAPKKAPRIPFTEMRWAILIRTPTLEPVLYGGGPFDIEMIDKAMTRLLDLLIEGAKQPEVRDTNTVDRPPGT